MKVTSLVRIDSQYVVNPPLCEFVANALRDNIGSKKNSATNLKKKWGRFLDFFCIIKFFCNSISIF